MVVCTQLHIRYHFVPVPRHWFLSAPSMDSPYNIRHTLVRVLHCCFIAKVRVQIPASLNFGGAFFSQPHELWRISLDGSCILTFNCFITHSKYFKFIKGYLLIVFFSKLWPISGKVSRYKKMSFEADNPQNKLSKCVDIPVFLPFSFSQKFSSFFVFCNSVFCSLLANLPSIPLINLISKQIYHQIVSILLVTSKFGWCQLVMKN